MAASTRIVIFFFLFIQLSYYVTQAVPLRNDEVSGESVRISWRSTLARELLPDYQPLCRTVNHRVDLHEPGYEFRPPFYQSIECKHTSTYKNHQHHEHHDGSDICLLSGLTCVQRTKTIQIAKRKIGTTCWSLTSKEIRSGCECMWPVESNGDWGQQFS